ncbi:VIT and vWA domain-containing protein [Cerasicoccus frondis]|uniref:VIT and vWA domain-containing protein n=1 Tax=Cerasicoccus frondis TaxID=490090 RepID=UPI002852A1A3|nr:VIT and VWA domain-containing protein [Cerasicoccus frondis]
MKTIRRILITLCSWAGVALAHGAGVLTPVNSQHQPMEIRSHEVQVVINNGFAQTLVTQTFYNPNPVDLEAVYAFPVPEDASLAEMRMHSGETILEGEVVAKADADRIYEEEKNAGNNAGKAEKQSYQRFEFRVSPVRANAEARMEFVYYQPVTMDHNVGRYIYPLEEGGTDEQAESFWTRNEKVTGSFAATVEIRSAYPLQDLRAPGFNNQFTEHGDGHYQWQYATDQGTTLNQDLVIYYRLPEDLPGRVDLLTHRAPGASTGTFMMIVTPGVDLQPLSNGADYCFVLDTSGSMQGKIAMLADGVERALGKLSDQDRFRIVTFNDRSRNLTRDWVPATQANVQQYIAEVKALQPGGSTNLYAGVAEGMSDLDDDRATNFILVTDAVANQGIVDPAKFDALLRQKDVRFFGFLMGNSANWPLMRILCEATDGQYDAVSNADDIFGKILLAKDRITTEALLDVDFKISGVKTSEVSRNAHRKLYRGQQLVLMGRYDGDGPAELKLTARKTEGEQTYRTKVNFPQVDETYPELERIWAMTRVQNLERQKDLGTLPKGEASTAIQDIGVTYQIVTDETSMLVLDDSTFAKHGIDRKNQQRMQAEHAAQAQRQASPAKVVRADAEQPMFKFPTPRIGGGGGAFEGPVAALMVAFAGWFFAARRRNRQ